MIGSASGTTAPSAPTSSPAGQVEQSTQRGMPVEFSVFEATAGFAECVVAVFVDHFPFDVFYGQKVRLVIHPDLFCFSDDALDAHDPAFNFVDGQADLRDIAVAPRKIIEKESKDECGEDVSHEDGGHGCTSLRLIACGMKHPIPGLNPPAFMLLTFNSLFCRSLRLIGGRSAPSHRRLRIVSESILGCCVCHCGNFACTLKSGCDNQAEIPSFSKRGVRQYSKYRTGHDILLDFYRMEI